MSGSPELLFVTPVTPAAGGNGLAMRAGLFLEGLARSHAVRVLVVPVFGGTPRPDGFVRRHASDFAALELDSHDPRANLAEWLGTPAGRRRAEALHPRPSLCSAATPAAAAAVAAAAEGCDAVHVLRVYLMPFLDALLDRARRPALTLDLDDLESAVHRRLGHPGEAEAYERLEAHYRAEVDHVITCSRADAAAIAERAGDARVTPVPNAVRLPARAWPPASRHDVLFVGNLSYAPNVDGVRWLCRRVVPLLDGATVALVGSRPGPRVRELATCGITIAADVPEVGPWYAGASVAVAPLRAGGGTRIKVLEALAHRRPVVATTVGAEGLELGDGDCPVLIADTAEGFAAACRGLLDEPRRAARIGRRGEAIVRESATVGEVAGTIDGLFRNILAG